MSFVLKTLEEITVPVTIHVPGSDEPSTIKARWRLHKVSEGQKIMEAQLHGKMSDDELVAKDLLGLEGITDEDGNEAKFDDALREQLMEIAYVRRPLVLSWFAAQQGRDQASAKN